MKTMIIERVFILLLAVMFTSTSIFAGINVNSLENDEAMREKLKILEKRAAEEISIEDYNLNKARAEQSDPQKELFRWDDNIWVFNSTNHEKHPSMCYDVNNDERIFIAAEIWEANTVPKDIAIKRSVDHGENWTMTNDNYYLIPGIVEHPYMMPKLYQISADKIGMIYVRQYDVDDWDVYFRSFSTANVSENEESSVDVTIAKLTKPSLCSDYLTFSNEPYIHAVYINGSASPRQLLYKRSVDLGISWQAPQILATISPLVDSDNLHTSIDVFGTNIAITYVDREGDHEAIKVLVSNNSGSTWGSPITISSDKDLGLPQIRVVDNNNIIVVFEYWFTELDVDIHYAYSNNAGSTFTDNLPLAQQVYHERFPNISSFKTGSVGSDVYVVYTMLPDEVYVTKALDLDFEDWSEPAPIKQTETDVSESDISAIIVLPINGVPKSAVAWAEHWSVDDIDIYFDGEWREETSVDDIETITNATILRGNYPNPFNPDTNIEFYLAEAGVVSINIYNIKGQKVKTLINDMLHVGEHRIVWNGENDNGQIVSSGIYFYNMTTQNYSETKKMILMK
ncbi:MAG: T9SS type A sorting domain-containing protein [Candidatus Cloacimonetes bacterium]|nr:T9SS type A sorting domain-containing protein [Candidatus Cloacimonadota bacterium]